jgi:hypothetical protein
MARVASLAVVAVILAVLSSAPAKAQSLSCRSYPTAVIVSQIKSRVEALRRIEREADDRAIGLDTRPYEWLLSQVRAGPTAIADPAALAAEAALSRCRNHIRPLRRVCAGAAAMLVRMIEELAADGVTKESKQAYVEAMPQCETWLGLMPLNTSLRTTD